ncbi:hypothetical protein OH809_44695 (plasmid) [Streptomyces sp. NBC_00873]|uniref:hypothetical protein n=1 Tax=unclassified Streptomyces TaxID=2593676 RepID=UPI002F914CE6|nr:hypothetical protein OH809_44695 [Streptomyces sp. NBC_00873]WTA49242.1 hypothetical protein OH821_43940 [Streptomyces sp. NBC_00842]
MTELFTDTDMQRIAAAAERDGQDPAHWLQRIVRERLDAEKLEDALVAAHYTVATRTAAEL